MLKYFKFSTYFPGRTSTASPESVYCNYDCVHYGSFGGEEGCTQRERLTSISHPEDVIHGGKCLHPDDKQINKGFILTTEDVHIAMGLISAENKSPKGATIDGIVSK